MKELKVGEELRIRCVKNSNIGYRCRDCLFYGEYVICAAPKSLRICQPSDRTDGKYVHYELVEE